MNHSPDLNPCFLNFDLGAGAARQHPPPVCGRLIPVQATNWRTTPCRLSATAYSVHSHLPFLSRAVVFRKLGSAMSW
jgi:hypothetical protein